MPTVQPNSLPAETDLLIVGAGVAGLYSAWRILVHAPETKIVIVDRLNRSGGRLDSDIIHVPDPQPRGQATIREEEGGMRFTYEMRELMATFAALGLCDQIVDFPMSSPGNTNRYCVRGHSFSTQDAIDSDQMIWSQLYELAPAEQGKSPTDLITLIYHQILAANGVMIAPANPQPEYWQRLRLHYEWDGKKLNQWQLSGLIRAMGYTQECIELLCDTLGFECTLLSQMNAGEALQLLEDFPANPNYHTFLNGFSTLPNALVAALEAKGVEIYLSTNVDSIQGSQGEFSVGLTVAPFGKSSNRWVRDGVKHVIQSKQIVLAVARKALETLYATSPVLHNQEHAQQLWLDLQSTTNQPLCKINLYFEYPWWNDGLSGQDAVAYGPNLTDLPANSVYPFYAIKNSKDPDQGENAIMGISPAALTIYCDFSHTVFWQGLQNVGPKFDSTLQQEHNKKVPQVMFPASQAIVDEAIQQFKQIFSTQVVPSPVLTSFRLWNGADDFGFAVHQWAIGAEDDQVIARLAQPIPGLYTCNEAYSDMQGWVEGSLRSANVMLESFAKIPPISTEQQGCPAPCS